MATHLLVIMDTDKALGASASSNVGIMLLSFVTEHSVYTCAYDSVDIVRPQSASLSPMRKRLIEDEGCTMLPPLSVRDRVNAGEYDPHKRLLSDCRLAPMEGGRCADKISSYLQQGSILILSIIDACIALMLPSSLRAMNQD